MRVFTVSPRRLQRAPSRNPGPRNSRHEDQEGRTPPFVRHPRCRGKEGSPGGRSALASTENAATSWPDSVQPGAWSYRAAVGETPAPEPDFQPDTRKLPLWLQSVRRELGPTNQRFHQRSSLSARSSLGIFGKRFRSQIPSNDRAAYSSGRASSPADRNRAFPPPACWYAGAASHVAAVPVCSNGRPSEQSAQADRCCTHGRTCRSCWGRCSRRARTPGRSSPAKPSLVPVRMILAGTLGRMQPRCRQ